MGTFTKLLALGLDQYRRVLFMDSDTLTRASVSPLLERATNSSHTLIHTRTGNTGVFVVTPSAALLRRALGMLHTGRYYRHHNHSEQSFLNAVLREHKGGMRPLGPMVTVGRRQQQLSVYNCFVDRLVGASGEVAPVPDQVAIMHWSGAHKPWHVASRAPQRALWLSACGEMRAATARASTASAASAAATAAALAAPELVAKLGAPSSPPPTPTAARRPLAAVFVHVRTSIPVAATLTALWSFARHNPGVPRVVLTDSCGTPAAAAFRRAGAQQLGCVRPIVPGVTDVSDLLQSVALLR